MLMTGLKPKSLSEPRNSRPRPPPPIFQPQRTCTPLNGRHRLRVSAPNTPRSSKTPWGFARLNTNRGEHHVYSPCPPVISLHSVIRPIVDSEGRVGGCFVDKPHDDESWDDDCKDAHAAILAEREAAGLQSGPHRRGNFVAVNTGNLVGAGSVQPGNLRLGNCLGLICRLIGRPSVCRIAHYQSGEFIVQIYI